jgi:hypothetical protein
MVVSGSAHDNGAVRSSTSPTTTATTACDNGAMTAHIAATTSHRPFVMAAITTMVRMMEA